MMKHIKIKKIAALLLALLIAATATACSSGEEPSSSDPNTSVPIVPGPGGDSATTTTVTTTTTTTTVPTTTTKQETTTTQNGGTSSTTYMKGDDPIDAKYADTVLAETADMGEDYLKDIVFIGDSRTVGYKAYGVLPDGTKTLQVWARESFQLTKYKSAKFTFPDDGSEKTIEQALAVKKPKIVIIELGLNSVSYLSKTKFEQAYGGLIDAIKAASPETKIICNSMYGVSRSYKKQDQINNTKIYTSNKWLMEVAYQKGVKYLNTASVLRDADGYLPENYQSGDGLHLKTAGYRVVLDYIRTHAYL